MSSSQETSYAAFPDLPTPIVSYGLPFPEACQKYISNTFKSERVYIICSRSLANNAEFDALGRLKRELGGRVAGVRLGMKPHTLFVEVLEIIEECRELDVDLIITLGGGSLCDGAKLISFAIDSYSKALANDVKTSDDLKGLPNIPNAMSLPIPHANASKIPIISIPTTLSGGEYTYFAGSTDDSGGNVKYQFLPPLKGPSLVILDAQLALTTPMDFWLSTGIRGVDHCVETLCSLSSDVESDTAASKSLVPLALGLIRTKAHPDDAQARLLCHIGVSGAMLFLTRQILLGASHGIGHMLGPLGVGHGETSCILLPAVCKYNAQHGQGTPQIGERQKAVRDLLWGSSELKATFERRGLREDGDEKADLGDLIDAIVRELGMPRSLSAVGVGRERFDALAQNSLRDLWVRSNPVPMTEKRQVMEILEVVA